MLERKEVKLEQFVLTLEADEAQQLVNYLDTDSSAHATRQANPFIYKLIEEFAHRGVHWNPDQKIGD